MLSELVTYTQDSLKQQWLSKAHSRTIYNRIYYIPSRHFKTLLERYNFSYIQVCKALMRDEWC